jgi:predicted  nucleic acid-binding Zn-ribbon protein
MINCLEQMETAEKVLSEKGTALKQAQMHINAEKETIQRSAGEDEKKIESAMKFVKELASEVDPSLLADYKRIKKLTPPPVVVPVSDAVCQGCHLNIPPQMFNELQRGDQLKFCPHCGRITYWSDMI